MLELVCRVYNIGTGNNRNLLSKCKWLQEYMIFVDKVRENHFGHDDVELHNDIEYTIDYCIEHNIFKQFFMDRRAEVVAVTKVDYTYERRMLLNYNEGKEDGRKDQLIRLISKKLAKNKPIPQIADELEEDEATIKQLIDEMQKENAIV